jgi:hypothetical protein
MLAEAWRLSQRLALFVIDTIVGDALRVKKKTQSISSTAPRFGAWTALHHSGITPGEPC